MGYPLVKEDPDFQNKARLGGIKRISVGFHNIK
jgi:hypothetical protein